MLFNSWEFLFAFLPVTFAGYFILTRLKLNEIAKAWLVLASLFFYAWWNILYLPLIAISIVVNYLLGRSLTGGFLKAETPRQAALAAGIIFNLGLLAYYKYAGFFLVNLNYVLPIHLNVIKIVLPLGISFFTFTQIAYLTDAYRRETNEYKLVNYALFVTFFPHLLAGPILHHREMMPQFEASGNKRLDFTKIAPGLMLIAIGLCKKVIIADTLAHWAAPGFDQLPILGMLEAWVTSLAYTMQLYFDFSGYTDIAIGAGLLFNIALPSNFNSPYKALNIQDFWRRWHITLGRFFRDYIYIPLGGSRKGSISTYANLFITFTLVGLWHGAGWTFILWGALHGVALIIHRLWGKLRLKIPKALAWFITFNFVNMAWVFFRASTFSDALKVLRGMVGLNGIKPYAIPAEWWSGSLLSSLTAKYLPHDDIYIMAGLLLAAVLVCLTVRNSMQMRERFKPVLWIAVATALLGIMAVINLTHVSEFLYFNF